MTSEAKRRLKLGTRGSLLARTQSQLVAGELEKLHAGLEVELVIIRTSGDIIQDRPLHEMGGKGLFTKELELALLSGEVDFAVHSFKDVPVTMPLVEQSGLVIAATPEREDPRDVLATRAVAEKPPALSKLPEGSVVGTGSLRRRCQVLAKRPDLRVEPIRGNIDTRLRRLDEGKYDAVILAMAGLRRTGLFDAARMHVLDPGSEMLPAPGQGALALQCRKDDVATQDLLKAMHDVHAAACVTAERELVNRLGGDCHSPIAALAMVEDQTMRLRAAVGARDGGVPVVYADESGPAASWKEQVDRCVRALYDQGAEALLRPDR